MSAPNSITVTAYDLITDAMKEIGALAAGEKPSNDDQSDVLRKLQRLIDQYNAREPLVYNVDFTLFNLTVGPNPVTIGPNGNFDCVQRPVSIPTIGLLLGGTPAVEVPLTPRDQDWWENNRIKGLTSSLPTDFYYSPSWPLGNIYFWPVTTAAYQVRVQSRLVVGEITSPTATFSMPPAYWDLIIYDLADSIGGMFERPSSPDLLRKLARAKKAVETNNISSPRLASDSPTQPINGSSRPDFNFLDGLSR